MDATYYSEISLPVDGVRLIGEMTIPPRIKALIIFSHGSGSSRHSSRNRQVANYLQDRQIGTLLFDLLTPEEDAIWENRFNIELLTERLVQVTKWLEDYSMTKAIPLGYFGASTGATSALMAAAKLHQIYAVVSRGGRPDLADKSLSKVKAPVLLIVGSHDDDVLALNESALEKLKCEKKLVVVEGATHLFEEKGALEQVAELAASWFKKHIPVSKATI
jgi:putative phosphoribosyl transferase